MDTGWRHGSQLLPFSGHAKDADLDVSVEPGARKAGEEVVRQVLGVVAQFHDLDGRLDARVPEVAFDRRRQPIREEAGR